MFGTTLGTGDYGHLTVEHVPMLFRINRSLRHLSNQGYEAGHKLQRMLYLRATSHDSSSSTSSRKLRFQSIQSEKVASSGFYNDYVNIIVLFYVIVDQIFTHIYTEVLLDMRRAFREARQYIKSGNIIINVNKHACL